MYVEPIDLNSDLGVVNAARASMDKWHDQLDETDTRLLNYLARESHWTPSAHPHCSFRLTAPLFVARQLAKHQVGLVWSEVSRRYVSFPPTYWSPKSWRSAAKNVKQGSGGDVSGWRQVVAHFAYKIAIRVSDAVYGVLLRLGVCPEQARAVLPQAMNTTWCWTGSLAAWNRVAGLRLDAHAQQECREAVLPIAKHCSRLYPNAWKALQGAGW